MILDEVKWGIIGCGDVCEKKSGPALSGVAHSSLAAVMRRDGAKAADYAKRHDVPRWTDDVDKLLGDDEVNCIYVATPDAAHAELTLRAATAGKHVRVETALALNAADCTQMIDTCRDAGVVLAVAYYRRGYPTILRAKRLIDEGAIGKLTTIYINDEFPLSHRLDLMHFFAGDAAEVWATEQPLPPLSSAVTGGMLYVQSQSGVVCSTPLGWDENHVAESLDIVGESGRIRVLDLKAGVLAVHRGDEKQREDVGPLPATHWGLIENFVQHMRDPDATPLACDGVEGRKSTVILDIVGQIKPDGKRQAVVY